MPVSYPSEKFTAPFPSFDIIPYKEKSQNGEHSY